MKVIMENPFSGLRALQVDVAIHQKHGFDSEFPGAPMMHFVKSFAISSGGGFEAIDDNYKGTISEFDFCKKHMVITRKIIEESKIIVPGMIFSAKFIDTIAWVTLRFLPSEEQSHDQAGQLPPNSN